MRYMAQNNKQSLPSSDGKGSALASGVAGAIIGAAAAAAAIALSDEKNRKKAEKVLGDLEKEGNSIFRQISRLALELKEKGVKALPKPKSKPNLKSKK